MKPNQSTQSEATTLHYRPIQVKQSCLNPINTHSPVGQLWRISTVINETGLSKTEVYRRIAAGNFPAPVKLGAKAVAWSSLAVQAWINDMIQGGTQ